MCYHLQK